MYICSLEKEFNQCEYFDEKTCQCNNPKPCGMAKKELLSERKTVYQRSERWYEQYYRK